MDLDKLMILMLGIVIMYWLLYRLNSLILKNKDNMNVQLYTSRCSGVIELQKC